MTLSSQDVRPLAADAPTSSLAVSARDHLWMHFTRMSTYANSNVPVIVRGEGPYIYDDKGKRYLDGLAGLFVVQAGHGREELAEAAVRQRVQRLLDAGVMQIVAVTDPLQVGFPRQAMIGIRCEGDVEAVA